MPSCSQQLFHSVLSVDHFSRKLTWKLNTSFRSRSLAMDPNPNYGGPSSTVFFPAFLLSYIPHSIICAPSHTHISPPFPPFRASSVGRFPPTTPWVCSRRLSRDINADRFRRLEAQRLLLESCLLNVAQPSQFTFESFLTDAPGRS